MHRLQLPHDRIGEGLARDVGFDRLELHAQIAFDLPQAASASLGIFDLTGRRVATLVSGTLEADHHAIRWNGRSDAGTRVSAGLSFARFSTPGLNRVSRLVALP